MDLENQFIELIDIKNIKSVGNQQFVSITTEEPSFTIASGLMVGTNAFVDTPALVLRDGHYTEIPVSELVDGDAVLTHTNHIRPIAVNGTGSAISVLISTHLGDIVVSHQSKIPAFNTLSNKFDFVEVTKLDVKIHKVIKNRLVDFQKLIEIKKTNFLFTNPKYDFGIELANGEVISTSKAHKFSAFDMVEMQYVFIEADKLDGEIHALVIS